MPGGGRLLRVEPSLNPKLPAAMRHHAPAHMGLWNLLAENRASAAPPGTSTLAPPKVGPEDPAPVFDSRVDSGKKNHGPGGADPW